MPEYKVIPHTKLKRDYKGKTIRTTEIIGNGYAKFPIGSIAIIEVQSPKGSSLLFNKCECCGIQLRISRVGMSSFEFIEEESSNDNQR